MAMPDGALFLSFLFLNLESAEFVCLSLALTLGARANQHTAEKKRAKIRK